VEQPRRNQVRPRAPVPLQNYQPSYSPYQAPPYYHLLNFEEREILHDGKISQGQVIGGGLLALFVGYGSGHAVQGRFGSTGWKFALAEVASIVGIVVAARQPESGSYNSNQGETLLVGSILTYFIARGWETYDAFAGPSAYNRRFRSAQWKAYGQQPYPYAPGPYSLYVAPSTGSEGGIAGLRLSF